MRTFQFTRLFPTIFMLIGVVLSQSSDLIYAAEAQGGLIGESSATGGVASGWYSNEEIGLFHIGTYESSTESGWIWHESYGWSWVADGSDPSSLYLWSQAYGWVWTSNTFGSNTAAYVSSEETWLHPLIHLTFSDENFGRAYNYATERWVHRDVPLGIEPLRFRTYDYFPTEAKVVVVMDGPDPVANIRLVSGDGFSVTEDGGLLLQANEAGRYMARVRAIDDHSGRSVLVDREINVFASQLILEGIVGPAGGYLTDPWQEFVLEIPEGAVEVPTTFRVMQGINDEGYPVYFSDTVEESVLAKLPLLTVPRYVPDEAMVGSSVSSALATQNLSAAALTTEKYEWMAPITARFLKIRNKNLVLADPDQPLGIYIQQDSTNRIRETQNEDYVDSWGAPNLGIGGSLSVQKAEASRLVSYLNPGDAQEVFHDQITPIILIHGFVPDFDDEWDKDWQVVDDYWSDLPQILGDEQLPDNRPRFAVFEFQWRTNARFNDPAADLGQAIALVKHQTGNMPHLIAHSFGGLLARTYLQDLAEGVRFQSDVASLITIGTPHSGIFGSEGMRHGFWMPDGTHGFFGRLIPLNRSLTGYQAGSAKEVTYTYSATRFAKTTEYDLRDYFGVSSVGPGKLIAELAATTEATLQTDTLALLGIRYNIKIFNSVTTQPYFHAGSSGDGLISIKGQRFHLDDSQSTLPDDGTPELIDHVSNYGNASVRELILNPDGYRYDTNGFWLDRFLRSYAHSKSTKGTISINGPIGSTSSVPLSEWLTQTGITFDNYQDHDTYLAIMDWLDGFQPEPTELREWFITGRVVDGATGAVISGAEIRLFSGGAQLGRVYSGSDGTFSMDASQVLGPDFDVSVRSAVYRNKTFRFDNDGDPVTNRDLGDLALAVDTPDPQFGSLTAHVVERATGNALEDVLVFLRNSSGAVLSAGYTNSNGELTFPDLSPASYTVTASLPDVGLDTKTRFVPSGRDTDVHLFPGFTSTPNGFSPIPAGSFTMGSPPDELGRQSNETQVFVDIPYSFYIKQTEVTLREWTLVREWAIANGYADLPAGRSGNYHLTSANPANHPVTDVNWYDALKWCNALSEREGLDPCYTVDGQIYTEGQFIPDINENANGYRLPTEAEWEYACRAGTTTAFYTGPIIHTGYQVLDPNLDMIGWYRGNNPVVSSNRANSKPVALKIPNGWGLYDMHGNALEFCWPISSGNVPVRGGRGYGGGNDDAEDCRSARRIFVTAETRWPDRTLRPIRRELTSVGPTPSGLIAHFPFDGDAVDEIGGFSFSEVSAITYEDGINEQGVRIQNGAYLRSNNFSDRDLLGNAPHERTIAFWVKTYNASADNLLFSTYESSGYDFTFLGTTRIYGGKHTASSRTGTSHSDHTNLFADGPPATSNAWTHIALVIDQSNDIFTLYVNGVAYPSNGGAYVENQSYVDDSAVFIGTHIFNGAPYSFTNAVFDDLMIFSRALSASEINGLME